MALGDRDCSLQRRFQKLVEIAPSPRLAASMRPRLTDAALAMAREIRYGSLGTFEFLVDIDEGSELPFVLIEANPRLQVEHTVSEEVTASTWCSCRSESRRAPPSTPWDWTPTTRPRHNALQWRLNAETLNAQGEFRPASGTIARFEMPSGPGCASTRTVPWAMRRRRSTTPFRPGSSSARAARAGRSWFVARGAPSTNAASTAGRPISACCARSPRDPSSRARRCTRASWRRTSSNCSPQPGRRRPTFPRRPRRQTRPAPAEDFDPPLHPVRSPIPARVVEIDVAAGDRVRAGQQLMVVEATKMQHLLTAEASGRVVERRATIGAFVDEGALLLLVPKAAAQAETAPSAVVDLDAARPDLQRVIDRHAFGLDANRPAAVAKCHAEGGRTASENIEDLCDAGSFIEYGALAVAAQTRRRTMDDLIRHTPHDGMVTGLGTVNAADFGPEASRCDVLA